jgi:hypothetical protein
MKLVIIAPLVAVGALCFAPVAAAAPNDQACNSTGGGTICQSDGNVQIDDAPTTLPVDPYGGDEFLLGGGFFGGFGVPHGGMGGFGGGHAGGHR